jgi:DNA-binding NarL/FixJ family response regulator
MAFEILIADDHNDVRKALKATLERHTDWHVCAVVGDGWAAVQKASELKPDAVILDFTMPVMDGIHAAREILLTSPTLPVLLYTSHASSMLEEEAKKAGVRQVLSKNASVRDLLEAIEDLAKQKRVGGENLEEVHDI